MEYGEEMKRYPFHWFNVLCSDGKARFVTFKCDWMSDKYIKTYTDAPRLTIVRVAIFRRYITLWDEENWRP